MMEWGATVEQAHHSATLVLSNETVPAKTERWLPLQVTRRELAPKAGIGIWMVMATALVTQRKSIVHVQLFGLEVVLVHEQHVLRPARAAGGHRRRLSIGACHGRRLGARRRRLHQPVTAC